MHCCPIILNMSTNHTTGSNSSNCYNPSSFFWQHAAELPGDVYQQALQDLEAKKAKQQQKQRRGGGTCSFLLLQFTYSLKDGKFTKASVGQPTCNLYLQYAAAVSEDVSREYMVVHMMDDDNDKEEEEPRGTTRKRRQPRTFFSYSVDERREAILRHGIYVNQGQEASSSSSTIVFHFLGCSNSQVQQHHYIFRRANSTECNERRLLQVLPNLRVLEQKKGIPKRVKYAGLLFSGIRSVHLPDELTVQEIDSIKHGGFDFTDGPGLISRKLARRISRQLGIKEKNYCPSVFQIRYCGLVRQKGGDKMGFVCKGVLLVDPRNDDTYVLQFRASMLKIQASTAACTALQQTLGICDYSQPSAAGMVGQQMVCLLSATVPSSDMLQIQSEHLQCVKRAMEDPFAMAWVLALDRKRDTWINFHKLLMQELQGKSHTERVPALYKKCVKAIQNHCNRMGSEKVKLPLAASRTLFGAVFPETLDNVLHEGECIVMLEDGPWQPRDESEEGFVIVSRSPSYYPGDIRVLKVVSLADNHPVYELRNCILFATQGDRPDPDKMGGGDLDGDKYLVVWHPILLKYAPKLQTIEPASYVDSGISENDGKGLQSSGDWIHYAAQTDNAMLGEVENAFYKLAKQYGISSTEISNLNNLFASLVDRNPASIDEFDKLKSSASLPSEPGHCLWEQMATRQAECVNKLLLSFKSNVYQKEHACFQTACAAIATSPDRFVEKVTKSANHHFLDAVRRADAEHTMSKVLLVQDPNIADLHSAGTHEVEQDPGDTASTQIKPTKLTNDANKRFEAFEEKVHQFFEPELNQMKTCLTDFQREVENHDKLRTVTRVKHKMLLNRLAERDLDLKAKETEVGVLLTQERINCIARCELKKKKVKDESMRKLSSINLALRDRQTTLKTLQGDLQKVENELPSMWSYMFGFSQTEVAAAERKEQIIRALDDEKRTCNWLKLQLENGQSNLRKELDRVAQSLTVEEEDIRKRLGNKRSRIEEEVRCNSIQRNMCEVRFYQSMVDIEKARLRQVLDNHEMEKYFTNKTENSAIDKLSVDGLRVEAMEHAAKVDSETSAKFAELNEKIESVGLGKYHVLYRLAQARLSWQRKRELQSMAPAQQLVELESIYRFLERNLDLERNRLLGSPKGEDRKDPLPVYHKRSLLRKCMSKARALIITAGTGCGKSTQIPQYVADDFNSYVPDEHFSLEHDGAVRVLCTQPRRVAAQKLAERVAEEYKTKVGDLVGFRVGSRGRAQEDCAMISDETVIEFVTEGLLLHSIKKSSSFLKRYQCVIIDEMHERNTEQDLCLALLRDYLAETKESRPSFKVVVMSASIDAQRFSEYFDNCPVLDCPGRIFPVEEIYAPSTENDGEADQVASHAVNVLFDHIVFNEEATSGDVLIFLSGAPQIDACVSQIKSKAKKEGVLVVAYPLYSRLDRSEISAATDPNHRDGLEGEIEPPKGRRKGRDQARKVVCCTNIAETSLTIPDVRFVIDSGRAKKIRFDHRLRCPALTEDWVSHASTVQRKGRAGRTNSGTCIYLYSKLRHESMAKYDTPAILDRPVDELILLSFSACQKSIEELGLIDTPSESNVADAKERLLDLGLIETTESNGVTLTSSGRVACAISSVRPESVRMILNACKNFPECVIRAIKLAILLSTTESVIDRYPVSHVHDRKGHVFGDHLLALDHLEWFEKMSKKLTGNAKVLKNKCLRRGLNFMVLKSIQEDIEFCHRELKKRKIMPSVAAQQNESNIDSGEDMRLLQILTSGYFHHVVRCPDSESVAKMRCSHLTLMGVAIFLDRSSVLSDAKRRKQIKSHFIDDDASQEPDDGNNYVQDILTDDVRVKNSDSNAFQMTKDEVTSCFLVYGKLTNVPKADKAYMLDASVIEGWVIAKMASERWLQRVTFDAEVRNSCRITIRNIGPSVLRDFKGCMTKCSRMSQKSEELLIAAKSPRNGKDSDIFEEIACLTRVDLLDPNYDEGCVIIVGSQSSVDYAKTITVDQIVSTINERLHRDRSRNNKTGFEYGSGMRVKRRLDKRPAHEVVRAYGTEEEPMCFCNAVVIRVDKKQNKLFAYPVRNASISTVETSLKRAEVLGFCLKKDNARFSIEPQPSEISDSFRELTSKLRQHESLSAETVNCDSFTKIETQVVWGIGHEAQQKGTFWQNACAKHLPDEKGHTSISFLPSRKCFALGPKSDKSQIAAKAFKNFVKKCSTNLNYHDVVIKNGFERYQLRRFVAMLAELKKSEPDTLFRLFGVENSEGHETRKIQTGGFRSDYGWLLHNFKSREIVKVRIWVASHIKQKSIKTLISEKFSPQALKADSTVPALELLDSVPRGSEWKVCVMCRRSVLVKVSTKVDKGAECETNTLRGWRLTLCGCSYCRECFRHGATDCLEDDSQKSVQCLKCQSEVLAKDCFEIIGNYGTHKEEWNQFCLLADARYCEENVALATSEMRKGKQRDRRKGWATCPDCRYPCIFPAGYRFFDCRNLQCQTRMCTNCRSAATEKCVKGQCVPQKED